MLDFVELIFISCRYPKEDSVLILKFFMRLFFLLSLIFTASTTAQTQYEFIDSERLGNRAIKIQLPRKFNFLFAFLTFVVVDVLQITQGSQGRAVGRSENPGGK